VSLALQKMQAEDLVERRADPSDLRQTRVYLTPKGKALDAAMRNFAKDTDEMITHGLTEQQLDAIYPILKKMRDNILSISKEKE
jgi:DNA-binding MarR family transcriptional regulator